MGGVKNLRVTDPTINSLTVRWDPAVGNVRTYKVLYTAEPGGEEQMVRHVGLMTAHRSVPSHGVAAVLTEVLTLCRTGGGVRRHHHHHPDELGSQHRLQCVGRPRVPGRRRHTGGREGKDK